jgi:hypothetical protein
VGHRLLEINDVDPAARDEDELAHFGVPLAGLVAKMDSGLEQFLERDLDGHGFTSGDRTWGADWFRLSLPALPGCPVTPERTWT